MQVQTARTGMAFRTTGVTVGKYEVGPTIGCGSSAEVKLGRHTETGEQVALKVYSKGGEYMAHLKAEITAFRQIRRHPHVIRLLEVLAAGENTYLVLEYASGGHLLAAIAAGSMPEAQARKYFQQLISAVSYCHSQGIYHRDIKPGNILLDAHGNVKLVDFGLSACIQDKLKTNGLLYLRCGTNYYMAPEVIDSRGNNGVTPDLWACGVILFYMLTNRLPFTRDENDDQAALFRKIKDGRYHMPKLSVGATHIVRGLLDPDPSKRMSCAALDQVEWFNLDYERPQLVALKPADLAQYRSNLDEVLRSNFK